MPQVWPALGAIDPTALIEARLQAHHAVQWVVRIARANLGARPDDSHANLGWDDENKALLSHELAAADGTPWRFGLHIASLTLMAISGEKLHGEFALDQRRDAEAGAWLDALATESGLHAASSVTSPYAISPHPIAAGGRYKSMSQRAELTELAHWYAAAADILEETRKSGTQIGADWSPLRCWPHHFDVTTSLTQAGNAETATSIRIGMSPGDQHYAQPYFHVSPRPRPPRAALPDLPAPGHWHQSDFLAAVATGTELVAMAYQRDATLCFIDAAVAASCRLLGAT